VNLHGGTIRAESAGVGYGSDFIIDLPASTLRGSAIEHEAEPRISVAQPRGPRVLVVDDNTDAAELLTEALQHLGYDVQTAHDGPSALERARAFAPDVALLDIGLPVMDGYELAERLRSSEGATAPPTLIAVTGYGQETDRNRTAAAGFAHHLVKPINIQELSSLLERVLAQD
jgi:CheY-like chemotaxis protein